MSSEDYYPVIAPGSCVENMKSFASSEENTTHDRETQRRSKPEICEWIDQIPFIHIEKTDTSRSFEMDSKFSKNQNNKENAELSAISGSRLREYYFGKECVHKYINSENKINMISGQNTPAEMNIPLKESTSHKVTGFPISKEKVVISGNILAASVPSGTREYISKIECNVCQKTFQSLSKLEDHYFEHEEHHSIFCRICEIEIDKHVGKGKRLKMYKCCSQNCTYQTDHRSTFKAHLQFHSNLYIFKCKCCGKKYRVYQTLQAHFRTNPNCEIFDKAFLNIRSKNDHRLKEH